MDGGQIAPETDGRGASEGTIGGASSLPRPRLLNAKTTAVTMITATRAAPTRKLTRVNGLRSGLSLATIARLSSAKTLLDATPLRTP